MFQKAVRTKAPLKIAITGPAGSGKTFSSLILASSIGKKIAVIDTENGSASLYSDRFNFDCVEIEPPFTIDKYFTAIEAAEKEKYDILVIDSITPAWAGQGGLLEKKQAIDSRGGNSYVNWGAITKEHEKFLSKMLHSPLHMISTIRSKQDYIIEQNEKGKSSPRKVGLAPIQRDGVEYEYAIVFDCGMDHQVQISKDRTGLFDGKIFQISEKIGQEIMNWYNGGAGGAVASIKNKTEIKNIPLISKEQALELFKLAKQNGWTPQEVQTEMVKTYKVSHTSILPVKDFDLLTEYIWTHPKSQFSSDSVQICDGGEKSQEDLVAAAEFKMDCERDMELAVKETRKMGGI